MVISTKCGNKFVDGKYLRCGSKREYFKAVRRVAEKSKRQTILIFIWYTGLDPDVELEETIDAVSTLKKKEKILHAGVSNFSKEQIEEVQKYCKIEAFSATVFTGRPKRREVDSAGLMNKGLEL